MATATIPTVPGIRPIVEIGVGTLFEQDGLGMWQRTPPAVSPMISKWQDDTLDGGPNNATTSHWVGTDPLWLDVSCHCHEFSTFTGRDRAVDEWDIGTATVIVENADGWADFPPTREPEHPLLTVRPGRPIRVGVELDGVRTVYLWGGYIDATTPGYDPEVGATVTFECIDAKGEAGRAFVGAVTTPLGAGESASARIARILTAANWPSWLRDLDSTGVTLRGTTLGAAAVDLLNRAAESSGGTVYGDEQARVAFRSRDNIAFDPAAPLDGTISNVPGGAAPSACPVSWELSFAREDISTRVLLARDTTTAPLVRDNVVARRLYGVETYERTDIETNLDVELGQIADRIREVRSPDYMPRIAAVTLDAATAPEVKEVLALATPTIPTRFVCRHEIDGREVFNRTMMVTAAEHVLSPDGWTGRISLDDARPFMAIDITRWQHDTGGAPPEARWEGEGSAINAPYARWMSNV